MNFNYTEMTTRNIGFVTQSEQNRLRSAKVFVVGTGGMGGACLQALVRSGLTNFVIADFDEFEVSNLNRQVFANMNTIGQDKAQSTFNALKSINPEANITVYNQNWLENLDSILEECKIVVNGMDDIKAGILLFRKAKIHSATVIDAYSAPLPSVFVISPTDPRPEERLDYPTKNKNSEEISSDDIEQCKFLELKYVMVHSSSAKAVHLDIAMEIFTGKRARISFAPMVITTGNLMAFEVIKLILGNYERTSCRGYFFNPWNSKVEKPKNIVFAWIIEKMVERFLAKVLQ